MPEPTAQAAPTRQRHNSLIHRHNPHNHPYHPPARPSWRNAAALVGLVLPLLVLLLISPAHAARLALVVGNADYADSPLKNPVNDARAMHAKLASLGFEVTPVENLRRRDIGRTVNGFASRIRPGDEVVVFYAGHGLQVRGINYLPAVDADIQSEEDVPLNSLNLNTLLERMDDAKAGVKLLFLDACRNNPYARSFRSSARGLARVQDAPSGTLMHFATRPGSVAADGSGKNGLYTTELLRHIDQPGTPIEQMLKRVAAAVERESKGQQEPWVEGSLKGDFYFKPGSGVQVASVAPVPTGLPVVAAQQADPEQEVWQAAKAANTVAAYDAYLAEYPRGKFASAARIARGALVAAGNGGGAGAATLANQSAVQASTASSQPAQPGQSFRDCAQAHCPELVVIPAGSFVMGSNDDDIEKPPHSVSVRSFALGKYEVTQGQWRAVMGSNPSRFSDCGDNCPVENVSWDDIQQYLAKLNQMTGMKYRLASEAEWEYAARAGCSTAFNVGGQCRDKIEASEANFDGNYTYNGSTKGVYREKPIQVGSFGANNWGLHDMHGNVWEWVEDVWHDNYAGAPTDGSAWKSGGNSSHRVVRGGSWNGNPVNLRSAFRGRYSPDDRFNFNGFRIARTVP